MLNVGPKEGLSDNTGVGNIEGLGDGIDVGAAAITNWFDTAMREYGISVTIYIWYVPDGREMSDSVVVPLLHDDRLHTNKTSDRLE